MRLGTLTRLALAGTIALTTATAMTGTAAAAAPRTAAHQAVGNDAGTLTSTVDGTFGDGGTVTGTFTPTEFAVQDGVLVAEGTLHAILTNADGTSAGTTDAPATIPVQLDSITTSAAPLVTCSILHLVLGPLNLNLLGLNVHLNTVVLDITAIPGAGNLLGNLLCAVAGLLDGTGTLSQIAALLNEILAALGL